MSQSTSPDQAQTGQDSAVIAQGVDDEPLMATQRDLQGRYGLFFAALCIAYTLFHILVMNLFPLETWALSLIHI